MLLLTLSTLANAGTVVDWDSVTDVAIAAWHDGAGRAVDARVDGALAAGRAGRGGLAVDVQSRIGAPGQQEAQAALTLPLRSGLLYRQAQAREADATTADGAAERAAYVSQVHAAFLEWWIADEVAEHLETWSGEVTASLQPVESGVHAGLIAPLEAEDLYAELASVRAEAADNEARATRAAARLQALLGGDVTLQTGGHDLHDLELDALDNPWPALLDRVDQAPGVQAHLARAEAADASARVQRAWTPSASAGVAVVDTGAEPASLAYIGVQLPLRGNSPAQARKARAEADAARADAAWATRLVQGQLSTEAASFDADLVRARRLRDEVTAPLARRLDRLEAAFAEGLVPADRLIRARRDHHEADHAQLEVAAGLLASQARADATRRLLSGDTP